MPLTFVCFKWQRIECGMQLPSVCGYTARHVNVLRNMLERFVTVPHQLICVTDDAVGIDPRVRVVPLWDKCKYLGGCFNRLWVFSKQAKTVFGERFICIDLDCVLVADCTDLFTRSDDFIINAYNPTSTDTKDQYYNGSMMMMRAGARAKVWSQFDPQKSPAIIKENPDLVGSDQAWIRHVLGKGESRWTNADGVYEARQVREKLPANARLIFFSGKRDPSRFPYTWVPKFWK